MTEIPEHLLKRSRDRRSSLDGEGGDSGAAASASPATVAAAAPAAPRAAPAPAAAAVPKAPKPDPAYLRAAKSRQKMPFWAMSALGLLPVWGLLYLRGMQPEAEVATGPLAIGGEVWGACSGCHGPAGGGGSGRQLNDGEVFKTFPHIEDQLNFVYSGSQKFALAGVEIYGDPNREGGGRAPLSFGQMPPQGEKAGGALTEEEILSVVCHVRYGLNDAKTPEQIEEFEKWCTEESEIFLGFEEGEMHFDDEELGIGYEPREATAGEGDEG